MRLYRNGQRLEKPVRLTPEAFPLGPGVLPTPEEATASGQWQVERLYKGEHDQWHAMGRSDADPKFSNMIDTPVPADKATYTGFLNSVDATSGWSCRSRGPAPTRTAGTAGKTARRRRPNRCRTWATRMNTMLQTRLHSEHLRLAALARDTIGDIRPETLRRMWAAEGVPKRIALGPHRQDARRAGDGRPAEGRQARGGLGRRPAGRAGRGRRRLGAHPHGGASRSTAARSRPADSRRRGRTPSVCSARARSTRMRYRRTSRPTRRRSATTASLDCLASPDVPLHFTMDLDWTVTGEFAVFGPMGLRGYAWRFVRMQDTAGTGGRREGSPRTSPRGRGGQARAGVRGHQGGLRVLVRPPSCSNPATWSPWTR